MISIKELRDSLIGLGIKSGMKLIVHSAFSSFGGVEGGVEAFCHTLMDIITDEGTLLMPSFTFSIYGGNAVGQPFDYLHTPSDTGIVTETFRKMPGVFRSADPCHATLAWGKDAWNYVKDHHKRPTVAQDSPIGLLEKNGGYILTVSCEPAVTFMHVVEYTNHVPCLGCRTEEYDGILADGGHVKLRTWGWRKGPCPALDTEKIFAAMRRNHEIAEDRLGNARLCLFQCSAYRKAYEPFLAIYCKTCKTRPRKVAATVPSDWDQKNQCLLPDSTAFTGDLPLK